MNDFSSQPFRLDEDGLCRQLSAAVSPRCRDLLQIAMRVYVADRLTKRNARADLDGPSRNMPPVSVPVSEPDFWGSKNVRLLLRHAVEFVSDDSWDFEFSFRSSEARQRSLAFLDDSLVCLYSGGLDSAAGLANRLREWNGMERHGPIDSASAERSVA